MPKIPLSDALIHNPREQRPAEGGATQRTTIALLNRDRIERVDLQLLLDYARPMSLRLPIGDVCTAKYLIDPALWAAASVGVRRYFGRVISFLVKRQLLPLEPVTSGGGTRLYRRIR